MPDEEKITIFHPPGVRLTNLRSSLGPVVAVEIPEDEFADPDIVVREEDFPDAV
jgi:hypothetical protein